MPGTGLAAGLIGGGLSAAGSLLNYGLQKQNYAFSKRQWRTMMQREDTAHQRAVADLQAAGLSPTLAAGAAAQTHQPTKLDAPQFDMGSVLNTTLTAMEAASRIKNAEADRVLKEQQAGRENLLREQLSLQNDLTAAQAAGIRTEQYMKYREMEFHDLRKEKMRLENARARLEHKFRAEEKTHLPYKLYNEYLTGKEKALEYEMKKREYEMHVETDLPMHGDIKDKIAFRAYRFSNELVRNAEENASLDKILKDALDSKGYLSEMIRKERESRGRKTTHGTY